MKNFESQDKSWETDLLERGRTFWNRKWPWCRTLGCVNKKEKESQLSDNKSFKS